MHIALATAVLLPACSDYELNVDPDAFPGDTAAHTGVDTIDFDRCEDGYYALYYNLPADHPDMEQEITGLRPGDLPGNHDWWDAEWFSYTQVDPGLDYGNDWWPLDEGLAGDPHYFAVHWIAFLDMSVDGTVSFELGSDDDSWAFIDHVLIADLGGIHAVEETTFELELTQGVHRLDLYMAERHTSQSGFWFRWLSDALDFYACP